MTTQFVRLNQSWYDCLSHNARQDFSQLRRIFHVQQLFLNNLLLINFFLQKLDSDTVRSGTQDSCYIISD